MFSSKFFKHTFTEVDIEYDSAMKMFGVTLHLETQYVTDPIANYSFPRTINGWQHFDITRDTNGRTQVYLNGEQIFDHTDENFTESQFFFLGALRHSEELIDNIVVRDTVVEIIPPAK